MDIRTTVAAPVLDPASITHFVLTHGAADALGERAYVVARQLLARHFAGDWGTVADEDAGFNDAAVRHGDRILGVYVVAGVTLWVIVDGADDDGRRYACTLLLPGEY